jgi:aconitate hydratase
VTAVLSGNRNFEGRINPDVKMNYLASPPLVVAYAIAGTMDFDLSTTRWARHRRQRRLPQGHLADPAEIEETIAARSPPRCSPSKYADVFAGDERWRRCPPRRQHLRVGRGLHLRPQGALLRRHAR